MSNGTVSPSAPAQPLVAVDYVVVACHFLLTVGLGLWSSFRTTKNSASNYFLAGRDMTWGLVGLSLYMSNIGSASFMGIAGGSAATGIAVLCYEFCGLFGIIMLGYLFIPVYVSSGAFTMPEYLKRRFGGSRLQIYLAVQNMILFVFTKLSGELYGGVVILQQALNIDRYIALTALLVVTTLYTILGGLSAVIYTDAMQGVIVVICSFILTGISMSRVSSYEAMEDLYFRSVANETLTSNSTCGLAVPNAFDMMRPLDDPEYPWLGISVGAFILSGWYFCTDQVLVQRILAAKDLTHARGGTALAAVLKVLPLFVIVWPGMVARILHPDIVACSSEASCMERCNNPSGCSNSAYFELVLQEMPVVLKGLMLSAMLAALMSSLTSIFNSAATMFTIDLWMKFRPKANNREQMIVSRLFTIAFLGVGIAWLPMVELAQGGQLFHYLQQTNSFLAPPLFTCFLMAILWPRMNEVGAFWGLAVGLVVGVARMIWNFIEQPPACGAEDTRSDFIRDFHYLHFAIALFVLTGIVSFVVTMATKPQPKESLVGMTLLTLRSKEEIQRILDETDLPELQAEKPAEDAPEMSFGERIKATLKVSCGISDEQEEVDEAVQRAMELRMTAAASRENPKWQLVVDILSAATMAAGFFIWGFFS